LYIRLVSSAPRFGVDI
jgi:uncharacterized protein involved in tellurium resistance